MNTVEPLDRALRELRNNFSLDDFSLKDTAHLIHNNNLRHTRFLIDSIFESTYPSFTRRKLLKEMSTPEGLLHFKRLESFELLLFSNPMRIADFLNDPLIDTFSKSRLIFLCCKLNNTLLYEVLSFAKESICSHETLSRFFVLSSSQITETPESILYGDMEKPSRYSIVARESLERRKHPCHCKSFKTLLRSSKKYEPAIHMLIHFSENLSPHLVPLLQQLVPSLQSFIFNKNLSPVQKLKIGELITRLGHPAPHSPILEILQSSIVLEPFSIKNSDYNFVFSIAYLLYISECRHEAVISTLKAHFLGNQVQHFQLLRVPSLIRTRAYGEERSSQTPMTSIGFSLLEKALISDKNGITIHREILKSILEALSEVDPERLKNLLQIHLRDKKNLDSRYDHNDFDIICEFLVLLNDTNAISMFQKWIKSKNQNKKYYALCALTKSHDATSKSAIMDIALSLSKLENYNCSDLRTIALLSYIESLYRENNLEEIPLLCQIYIHILHGDSIELFQLLRKINTLHSYSLLLTISKVPLNHSSLWPRAQYAMAASNHIDLLPQHEQIFVDSYMRARALNIPRPQIYYWNTLDALVSIREGLQIEVEKSTLWLMAIDDYNGALNYSTIINQLILEHDEPVLIYGFSSLNSLHNVFKEVSRAYKGKFKRIVISSHASPYLFTPLNRENTKFIHARDLESVRHPGIDADELLLLGCSTGQETLQGINLLEAASKAFPSIDQKNIKGAQLGVSPKDINVIATPSGSCFVPSNPCLFISHHDFYTQKARRSS